MSKNAKRPNHDAESTSTTLIEQLRSGDEDSWAYFLFAYRPLIVNWALRAGASRADAADVAQEVVSNVVRGMETYQKGDRAGSFRKWLKTITQNKTVDYLRKGERMVAADGGTTAMQRLQQVAEPSSTDETRLVGVDDRQLLVQRTMDFLRTKVKPHTFEAFHRVVIEGHDPQQVASDLNIHVNVVYQASSRMLKRLRKMLEEESD